MARTVRVEVEVRLEVVALLVVDVEAGLAVVTLLVVLVWRVVGVALVAEQEPTSVAITVPSETIVLVE